MTWNTLNIAVGVSLFLILLVAGAIWFAAKAMLRASKSPRERTARKRFGWKLGIATVLLVMSCSINNFVDVTSHPVLAALSILFGSIFATFIYAGLVVLWSFQHTRELKQIASTEAG